MKQMKPFASSFVRLALVAAGLALCLSSVALAGETQLDEAPPPQPAADGGAELYAKSCAKCHGPDGKGDTGMGKKGREKGQRWPELNTSKLERDKVLAILRDGIADSPMKAYGDKMTASELAAVTDFVIGLRK